MSQQTTESENTDPFKPYKGRFKSYHSIRSVPEYVQKSWVMMCLSLIFACRE